MYLISACLAGEPCRMDGRAKPVPEIQTLVKAGKAVLVCPEVLGGLDTPRSPSERQSDGRVVNRLGQPEAPPAARGRSTTAALPEPESRGTGPAPGCCWRPGSRFSQRKNI